MKKNYCLLAAIVFVQVLVAQTNTFPASGNVGIGTLTPGKKLEVNGLIGTTVNQSNYLALGAYTTTDNFAYYSFNSDAFGTGLKFETAAGPEANWGAVRMTITNEGNVGIGTTTPKTKLDLGEIRFGDIASFPVEGQVPEGDWGNYIIGDVNVMQRLRLGVANDGHTKAEIFIDNSNQPDGKIYFKTSSGGAALQRMMIDGNGRVGIGTSNIGSGYKLFVEEGIRTRKIKIDQLAWPDYVFHPSYTLLPLSELKQYIDTYHHLPEVLSAAEVKKDGLDLGDNQAVLLKKIEELTLYVISLQNQLDKLRKDMERPEKK